VVLRPNHWKTVAIGFEAQTDEKLSEWFWGQTTHKPSQWFWGQITDKPSTLVLRLNQETYAPRLHVHSVDRTQRHLTSRSSGHWVSDLCDHLRFSAPGLLLLPQSSSLPTMPYLPPAHHETSKHDSPNEQDKGKTTKMSWIQFQTLPSQWLITIKPRNWQLGFSISPWWFHWQQKTQRLKFESKTPWSTTRRPEANEKLKKVI
jgi:hypothetical protein